MPCAPATSWSPCLLSLFSTLEAFDGARSFSATEAHCCYLEAIGKGPDGLAQLLLPRVSESFLILVAAPVFRQLSAQCVCGLLGSNHVASHSEIEVLYAAVTWLCDDYVNRIKHIKSLQLLPAYLLLHWADHLAELKEELARELRVCLRAGIGPTPPAICVHHALG
ncbi:uncharacterized protein LOC117891533 [Drosophila subobscura]|uniref:uncharacterized protein LOC117891533 n=1 Tax=Drosophila subobscura TaxID=7241 RepID=UPI00155AB26A|nr:uncharacterized protein LOC117891533 [Drosophila subobscura]